MDDTVNVRVRLEDLVESGLIGDVQLGQLSLLARDQLNAVEGLSRGIVQVVSNDDLVASLEQGEGGEGANVTGTTAMRRMVGLASGTGTRGTGQYWSYPVTRTEPADMMREND